MGHYKRLRSEGDVYHVFARGTSRRIIFEEDKDREEYCRLLGLLARDSGGEVYAWCLMDNHVHLLLHMEIEKAASLMKRLHGRYATYFNGRHMRTGHLFEGRFGSEPIDSDEQAIAALRYIHRNPVKAGISEDCSYPWSSYLEYLSGAGDPIASTEFMLGLIGGREDFRLLHEEESSERFLDVPDDDFDGFRRKLTTDEAVALSKKMIGEARFELLASLPRRERDESLRTLKDAGLTIRQIELITGIGRNTVWAA